jgi:response regulator of citrate/malate metabolism
VVAALRASDGLSAETAGVLRTSRTTARRYLEHLVETAVPSRTPRCGGAGRQETEYRWK